MESYGLRLEAIENVPNSFYSAAMLGLPGRDAEIDGVVATVARTWAGRASAVLGFHWMPASVWRTAVAPDGRGGAVVSAFDLAAADRTDQVYVARRDRRVEDAKDSDLRVDGGVLAGVALPAPTTTDT